MIRKVFQDDVVPEQESNVVKEEEKTVEQKAYDIAKGVMDEVVEPAFNDVCYNIIEGVARRIFQKGVTVRPSSQAHTKYITTSQGSISSLPRSKRPEAAIAVKHTVEVRTYEALKFQSSTDAANVINGMKTYLTNYGVCPVNVIYEDEVVQSMLNKMGYTMDNFMIHKWGWTDLSNASIRNRVGGWVLILPDPEPLKV